ncbi:YihY family inner membrane protein [Candidatus Spongiihabitans sp.]|uniref:YihY family inner membrane protein n=1 Tax=Candidatus Spongiihabitans sp. TaxID=3101308 RepID=UPI003C7DED21
MWKLEQPLNQLKSFSGEVFRRFNQDCCFSTAAALSFTTLLALVPLVTVIFSMLSLFPVFGEWSSDIETFLFENFMPAASETVKGYILEFSDKAGKLTAVGLVFLLLSSLFLLATIEDAFNEIWKIRKGRDWFLRLIVYWSVLTLGPVLIAISLSMSSALLSMSVFSEQPVVVGFTQLLLKYLPILFELCAFMLFYQAIPNLEIRVRDSFVGGVVATVLFEALKLGFGIYLLNFNSYQRIYGALATIPIFFLWIYLCWLVLLAGALVAAILREKRPADSFSL